MPLKCIILRPYHVSNANIKAFTCKCKDYNPTDKAFEKKLSKFAYFLLLHKRFSDLLLKQFPISTSRMEQLHVRALFHHPAIVHEHDVVGMKNGAQPMRGNHHGASFGKTGEMIHNPSLVQGIERRGGFIKEQKARLLVDGPGNEQPLTLPAAELQAGAAEHGVIAHGKLVDEFVDAGRFGRILRLFIGGIGIRQGNVVQNRVAEDLSALQHRSTLRQPSFLGEIGQGHIPHLDGASLGRIEPEQEFEQGGLSTATFAYDGGGAPFGNVQGDIAQTVRGKVARILEPHPLQTEIHREVAVRVKCGGIGLFSVHHLVQAFVAHGRILHLVHCTHEVGEGL